jgi:hypothetical protein
MINVSFNCQTVDELQVEMRSLLNGQGGSSTEAVTQRIADATAAVTEARKPASGRTRQTAAEKAAAATTTGQGVSTGEERTDPAVDAQDAKDEAADTAAAKTVDLTHDGVKKMLGGYVQAYGMEAAQADGTGFIGAPKISEIPNTQVALAKAIIGIAQGIEKNPNKRDIAGDGLSAEKTAELKPLVTAALAVK